MDWVWLLLAVLAALTVLSMICHTSGTSARTNCRSPRVVAPLTHPTVWTPGNGRPLDEARESYHRSNMQPTARDLLDRAERRRNVWVLQSPIPPRNDSRQSYRADSVPCYTNWRNVEGDDELLDPDENETREEINESLQCKICFTNKINTVFLPCFHAAVCISCANRLQETRVCPICRNPIDTPRRIFL